MFIFILVPREVVPTAFMSAKGTLKISNQFQEYKWNMQLILSVRMECSLKELQRMWGRKVAERRQKHLKQKECYEGGKEGEDICKRRAPGRDQEFNKRWCPKGKLDLAMKGLQGQAKNSELHLGNHFHHHHPSKSTSPGDQCGDNTSLLLLLDSLSNSRVLHHSLSKVL